MNLHRLNLNEIRGFGRKKPLLAFLYLMGALGISGMPLWSGYISKTLLHESIVEYTEGLPERIITPVIFSAGGMKVVEWAFLISGGLTAAYMTKLFAAVFVEKNNDAALQERYDAQKNYMSPLSAGVLLAGGLLFPVMGMLPGITMNRLADLGQGFMGLAKAGERVSYFSPGNLKGGLISIAIGAVLYLLTVRGWMMKRGENSVYIDRWPKFLDLEEYLYRPVLLVMLPKVCCGVCGALDTLVDAVVVLLRKTVYRDHTKMSELKEGNWFTYILGSAMNNICGIMNRIFWKKHPNKINYKHKLALDYWGLRETIYMITRSLSYGLILFSIGLCATLIYLLVGAVK